VTADVPGALFVPVVQAGTPRRIGDVRVVTLKEMV
jgi:hypothetical protein